MALKVRTTNPFDDDIDNTTNPKSAFGTADDDDNEDDALNFYQRQIEQSLGGTLDSTKRSLQALEESERVGFNTAQDLLEQGEKLRKVDRQLTDMQATTNQTQRHLNNIKSVFGGIKNYFSKPTPSATTRSSAQKLDPDAEKEEMRQQSQLKLDGMLASVSEQSNRRSNPNAGPDSQGSVRIDGLQPGTRWGEMDREIDENLDVMSAHLQRLRGLGTNLGQEIEEQNQLIDQITTKAERVHTTIDSQDKQMKRLLGAKKK